MKRYPINWSKYFPKEELCPTCGQPDSCDDCNHNVISKEEAQVLLPENADAEDLI